MPPILKHMLLNQERHPQVRRALAAKTMHNLQQLVLQVGLLSTRLLQRHWHQQWQPAWAQLRQLLLRWPLPQQQGPLPLHRYHLL